MNSLKFQLKLKKNDLGSEGGEQARPDLLEVAGLPIRTYVCPSACLSLPVSLYKHNINVSPLQAMSYWLFILLG